MEKGTHLVMCKKRERTLVLIHGDQVKTRAMTPLDDALMDLLDSLREQQDEAYFCHPKRSRELGQIMQGVRYARQIINQHS
jgi:hypothetical protein